MKHAKLAIGIVTLALNSSIAQAQSYVSESSHLPDEIICEAPPVWMNEQAAEGWLALKNTNRRIAVMKAETAALDGGASADVAKAAARRVGYEFEAGDYECAIRESKAAYARAHHTAKKRPIKR